VSEGWGVRKKKKKRGWEGATGYPAGTVRARKKPMRSREEKWII